MVAFSFNNKEGEKSIHMNKEWRSDQGYSIMKTPTCMLLNPDQSFNSFGHEAKDKFADLKEQERLDNIFTLIALKWLFITISLYFF